MANSERIDRRIQELEERLKQEKALLDRLKARKVQADRKADTRRKILIGAVVAKKAKEDPAFYALLVSWLDVGLTAARDRELFDLNSPETASQTMAVSATPANDDQDI